MKSSTQNINLGAVSISVSDYASQGNAILGIRDSGKTYTATAIAEQLIAYGVPIVAFDPIGIFKYLRHGECGIPMIVAGGNEGDVQLTRNNAVPLIQHAMKEGASIVFDLYDIALSKADWRHIVAEVTRTMLYENKPHGRRHVFLEEAAEFVPQMVRSENGVVFAELEKLARMGGNAMLGLTVINQRAEQLNKSVLELCDCLFLHRQKGRLSLSALTKWLDFGDKSKTADIIAKMPLLEQGECYVWQGGSESPEFTQIPAKATFHPNRREQTDIPPSVGCLDLLDGLDFEALEPKKAKKPEPAPVALNGSVAPEPIKVPVFSNGEVANLQTLKEEMSFLLVRLEKTVADINSAVKRADIIADRSTRPAPVASPARARPKTPIAAGNVAKGPRRILQCLATQHPSTVSMRKLSLLSALTLSSLRTYLPKLRSAEMVYDVAGEIGVTAAGIEEAGEFESMPTGGRDLLNFWCQKVTSGEAKIAQALFEKGRAVSMEELERLTTYTASSLRTYLPRLRAYGIIDRKTIKIADEFLS